MDAIHRRLSRCELAERPDMSTGPAKPATTNSSSNNRVPAMADHKEGVEMPTLLSDIGSNREGRTGRRAIRLKHCQRAILIHTKCVM